MYFIFFVHSIISYSLFIPLFHILFHILCSFNYFHFHLVGNDGKPFDTVEIYDPETDTWSSGKNMALSHCSCAYITHHGKLYVIGGLSAQGPTNCMECISYGPVEDDSKAKKTPAGRGKNKKQS